MLDLISEEKLGRGWWVPVIVLAKILVLRESSQFQLRDLLHKTKERDHSNYYCLLLPVNENI